MNPTQIKILIADDERVIAKSLALILKMKGYVSRAVYSGEDAVAAAVEFTPDILVSDVIMEGITGIEAAVQIRRICPNVRVILFSGQAATSSMLEVARGQEFTIFAKPLHPETLLKMLAEGHAG